MCGVLGVATRAPLSERDALTREIALAALRHRGPDARGAFEDRNVWFGHTRLSILDPSAAGNQPIRSPDGRYVITYNGEVYNFRELARENGLDDLRSGADSEVVLRLFAKLGVDSLIKLNGMFAFAVYDTLARRMWLVRDRLGVKPLYYRLDTNGLMFSSEIKSIVALSGQSPACDIAALHQWLYYGNALGGRTLYGGISQLLPGSYLEVDLESFAPVIREYWSLDLQAHRTVVQVPKKHSVISETRHLLELAVQRQLVSDVPVGVFLSGGVDSSAIVAFASRHYGKRLATYSAGFDFSGGGGELPKARRVAAHFGTDHHEVHVAVETVGSLIEKMVHHHDAPFADAANLPLHLMATLISAHTKVILQGDGGDELFGGYRRYRTLSHLRLLGLIARSAQGLHLRTPKTALHYRVQRYLNALSAKDVGTTIALLLTPEDPSLAPAAIFGPQMRQMVEQSDPFSRHRECQRIFANLDPGNQVSLVDLMITLPDIFLEKVDRSTMAASMEIRVPFLDHELVDYVVQLPSRLKLPGGRQKWLLKEALKGIVPGEVLYGPKVGLEVPVGSWLRGGLRQLFFDHLSQFDRRHAGVLDVDHVRNLYERTTSGRQNRAPMLWKVLNLMIWTDQSKVAFPVSAPDHVIPAEELA